MKKKPIVLAFSGGLDTSFCVPWLVQHGYEVTTLFVDTGGVQTSERDYIQQRAMKLGAVEHVVANVADKLWSNVVTPLLWAGQWYQSQYPLLCSDRYLIVQEAVALSKKLGANALAHGCTGMGNDQVRFDLTIRLLSDLQIVAPIRELQKTHHNVRDYEQTYLSELGFDVREKTGRYSINENLLGVTISGAEIDRWETPNEDAWQWTANASQWPETPLNVDLEFERGIPVALDGDRLSGVDILNELNGRFGAYGVGRGIYTGDTTIGLKGRIAFEAPGVTALCVAHRSLEEATATRHQNQFKPVVGTKWVELVYQGFFFEPLKRDLEAYLRHAQENVTGTVTLTTGGGQAQATAVVSDHILKSADATYAQSASWSPEEAEGFVKLLGQSSSLWTQINAQTKTHTDGKSG